MVLTLLAGIVLAGAGSAARAQTSRAVRPSTEAWYQTSPTGSGDVCLAPTDCAQGPPARVYREDTLHVAASAGQETARVFLALDLDALPANATVTGGTLTVPVLRDAAAGSLAPESASLVACGVPTSIGRSRGGPPSEQPPFDCALASGGRYLAQAEPPAFEFDLAPLAAVLRDGGLVVKASSVAAAERQTFHVVVPAQEHAAAAAIGAVVRYDVPAWGARPAPPPVLPAPGGGLGTLPFATVPPLPAPAAAGTSFAAPRFERPPPAPVVRTAPISASGGYAYPGVWMVPLVLAILGALLAQSLGGPVVLPDDAASPPGPRRPPGLRDGRA